MTCVTKCLNGGLCSLNNTCLCPECFIGADCKTNMNVVQFSLTYAMRWDIRQSFTNSNSNIPECIYITTIAVLLLMAIVNNIICLQTFFQHDIRSTNCGIFKIAYCCGGLISIIGMQLRMLTMLEFDSLIQTYTYRYIACNIIPVIVIIVVDTCMWLSALLAIEFVLLECFNLSLYRSRWFSVLSSIICLILTSGSHLHQIIARRPLSDPNDTSAYSCTFIYPLPIDIIDKTLRTGHIIIPCGIHFITSILILISMTRRILLVYSRHDYYRIFINQCIKRKHFFVPPLAIILSNLPHLILHLKDRCENAENVLLLRTHIAFNILVYLPPSITFFIYIYPSQSYKQQFKKTVIGRWLKRIFRKRKIHRIRN